MGHRNTNSSSFLYVMRGYAKEPNLLCWPKLLLSNTSEAKQARQRDGNHCILTKHAPLVTEVYHIIPLDLLRLRTHLIKELEGMRSWYTEESMTILVEKLTSESRDENIIDTRRNMICLDLSMGECWFRGESSCSSRWVAQSRWSSQVPAEDEADEPQTKSVLVLALIFYWLRKTEFPGMQQIIPFDTDPRQHFEDHDPMHFRAFNVETNRPLLGGEIIRISAHDEKDLPDYDPLDLRANLFTAFSLAAAVDPRAYKFDDDGDNNCDGDGDNEDDDFDDAVASRSLMRMRMKEGAHSQSNLQRRIMPLAATDETSHAQHDSDEAAVRAVSPDDDGNKGIIEDNKTVDEIQLSTA
ncbi:hypothetical protein CSAL01_12276 [Colletotrichum salicis]|uniref:HNH nuclease domain-containing protein n=1 Tax=Colletotrichum salicis TaxID=1209931 RepID=A0A135V9L1_9PEZI|nr:hypothetical protein CSAL01_12276 [Colletotrichum salicis]